MPGRHTADLPQKQAVALADRLCANCRKLRTFFLQLRCRGSAEEGLPVSACRLRNVGELRTAIDRDARVLLGWRRAHAKDGEDVTRVETRLRRAARLLRETCDACTETAARLTPSLEEAGRQLAVARGALRVVARYSCALGTPSPPRKRSSDRRTAAGEEKPANSATARFTG